MSNRTKSKVSRRRFIKSAGAVGAASLGFPAIIRAQEKEIFVGGPAGMATVLREKVFPIFEEKYNARVLYEGSRSLVNLEKLRANKDKPVMSAVLMDDPVMIVAQEEDLIARLTAEDIPNLSNIVPTAVMRDGAWAAYAQPVAGIAYNTARLPNGVGSWSEMWDSAYESRIIVPSLQNTEGLWNLIAAAHLETGKPFGEAQYDVDAGFKKLGELKPNLLTIYTNAPQALNVLEQGEAWMIGGQFSSYTLLRKQKGAPMDLSVPREGGFAMPSGVAKVKNGPVPDLANKMIGEFLGPDFQRVLSVEFFSAPTNPATDVPPDLAPRSDLFVPDWEFIAKNRESLIERWEREIAS